MISILVLLLIISTFIVGITSSFINRRVDSLFVISILAFGFLFVSVGFYADQANKKYDYNESVYKDFTEKRNYKAFANRLEALNEYNSSTRILQEDYKKSLIINLLMNKKIMSLKPLQVDWKIMPDMKGICADTNLSDAEKQRQYRLNMVKK